MKRLLPVLSLFLGLGVTAVAEARPFDGNTVYVMTNSPAGNSIAVLKRDREGALHMNGSYLTGGIGPGAGIAPATFDPLAASDSVVLTEDQRTLIAVNAASNQVSTMDVVGDSLRRSSLVSSGGTYPVSIAQRGPWVYVLNAGGDSNITGFRLNHDGRLLPIPGSTRSLNHITPIVQGQADGGRSPSNVKFSPDGKWLVVSIKNIDSLGEIQVFGVNRNGSLTPSSVITASRDPRPFAISFDFGGHLQVVEANAAAISTYNIRQDGNLELISASVLNHQRVTCWISNTPRWTFVSSSPAHTVSSYLTNPVSGTLTLSNESGIVFDPGLSSTGSNPFPADMKVSLNYKYLNVISGGFGVVDSLRINQLDGSVTRVNSVQVSEPFTGLQGIAVN